jgi:plastocyanin domain-containing protein
MLNLSLAFQIVNCVSNIALKMSENLATERTLKTKIQLNL